MSGLSGVSFGDYRALNQLLVAGAKLPERRLSAGALVRAVRVRLKMSQRALARRSGIPQPALARIERGSRDPQVGTLLRLFGAMGCELALVPRPRVRLGDAVYAQAERVRAPGYRAALMRRPASRAWNE